MSKLTKYDFVEIFNERKTAGKAQYEAKGGRLPVKEIAIVGSTVTGLFCAERDVLLLEFTTDNSAATEIDELPKGHIETIQGVNVTKAVRELPERADDWHMHIRVACAAAFPRLNEDGEPQ